MSDTIDLVSTNHVGCREGTPFADSPPSGHLFTSTINKIAIRAASNVLSLRVTYGWSERELVIHGLSSGGSFSEFTFDASEYITGIEGRLGPFGGKDGEAFKWGTTNPSETCRMRLLVFAGSSDKVLRGLQATFAAYHESSTLYEPGSAEPGASLAHSTFGRYLTSAAATLLVGPQKVKLHAHESVLCKLPFFQAALHGGFREASEKLISLPEDDPANVFALIEFLYTGNYTYTYDPHVNSIPEGFTVPAANITEGLYHTGVCVLALKYDAADLATRAMKNFGLVSSALDSINALRLWKTVYVEGLQQLPRHGNDFEMWRDRPGIVNWVNELFTNHREEMDATVLECPQLMGDLLRIVTGG